MSQNWSLPILKCYQKLLTPDFKIVVYTPSYHWMFLALSHFFYLCVQGLIYQDVKPVFWSPSSRWEKLSVCSLTPVSHMLRLQCVCSPCACGAEAAHTHCAFKQDAFAVRSWSVAVFHKHNIYPLFWFQIQTLLAYTESYFTALWSSFITVQLHNIS